MFKDLIEKVNGLEGAVTQLMLETTMTDAPEIAQLFGDMLNLVDHIRAHLVDEAFSNGELDWVTKRDTE